MSGDRSHRPSQESRDGNNWGGQSWTRTPQIGSKTSHSSTSSKYLPMSTRVAESFRPQFPPERSPEPTPPSGLKDCDGAAAKMKASGDTAISVSTRFQLVIPQLASMTEQPSSAAVVSSSQQQRSDSTPTSTTSEGTTFLGTTSIVTSTQPASVVEGTAFSVTSFVATSPVASAVSSTQSASVIKTATVAPSQSSRFSAAPGRTQLASNSTAGSLNIIMKMSVDAKVGASISIAMVFLAISILTILFCTRNRRRRRLLAAKHPSVDPRSIFHTPVFYNRNENSERASLDTSGIRWPQKVKLRGDAKEIYDLTRECEGEYKSRRPLSCRKKREETEMVMGRIGVADLRTKKLGGSW
jgi:hypothetical protein